MHRGFTFKAVRYIYVLGFLMGIAVRVLYVNHYDTSTPITHPTHKEESEESTEDWLLRMNALRLENILQRKRVTQKPISFHYNVPGGIVSVPFDHNGVIPIAYYNGKRLIVKKNGNKWIAIVGIPLSAKSGQHHITVQNQRYYFKVIAKQYDTQKIIIDNKRKVTPNKSDLIRIKREEKLLRKVLAVIDVGVATFPFPMQSPVVGRWRCSGRFGLKRFFNKKPRNPHSGLDIVIPKGHPVLASADGNIVIVGDHFFTGKTVVISHGNGVFTLYAHLSNILVSLGRLVEKGQIVGNIGKSGRATGYHLHWGVIVNQSNINPENVVEQSICKLKVI